MEDEFNILSDESPHERYLRVMHEVAKGSLPGVVLHTALDVEARVIWMKESNSKRFREDMSDTKLAETIKSANELFDLHTQSHLYGISPSPVWVPRSGRFRIGFPVVSKTGKVVMKLAVGEVGEAENAAQVDQTFGSPHVEREFLVSSERVLKNSDRIISQTYVAPVSKKWLNTLQDEGHLPEWVRIAEKFTPGIVSQIGIDTDQGVLRCFDPQFRFSPELCEELEEVGNEKLPNRFLA